MPVNSSRDPRDLYLRRYRRDVHNSVAHLDQAKQDAALRKFDIQHGLATATPAEKRKATILGKQADWLKSQSVAERKAVQMLRSGLVEDDGATQSKLSPMGRGVTEAPVNSALLEATYKKMKALGMTKGVKPPSHVRKSKADAELKHAKSNARTLSHQDRTHLTGASSLTEHALAHRNDTAGNARTQTPTERILTNGSGPSPSAAVKYGADPDAGYAEHQEANESIRQMIMSGAPSVSAFEQKEQAKRGRISARYANKKMTAANEARDERGHGLGYIKGDPEGKAGQRPSTDTFKEQVPQHLVRNVGKVTKSGRSGVHREADTFIDLNKGSVAGAGIKLVVALFREERQVATGQRERHVRISESNTAITSSLAGSIKRSAEATATRRKITEKRELARAYGTEEQASSPRQKSTGWKRTKSGKSEFRMAGGKKVYRSTK